MNAVEDALDKAFAAQVGRLYSQFVGAMVAAGSDVHEKEEAKRRFEKGLKISGETLDLAKQSGAQD